MPAGSTTTYSTMAQAIGSAGLRRSAAEDLDIRNPDILISGYESDYDDPDPGARHSDSSRVPA